MKCVSGDRQIMSSSKINSQPKDSTWNYEDTIAKAEKIVSEIESGNLSLSDLFVQFSLASDYLQQCEQFLEQKRQQINISVESLKNPIEE